MTFDPKMLNGRVVNLDDEKSALILLDQTKLPGSIEFLELTAQEQIHNAIYTLQVRGAPAIGVAAAIGIYLAAKSIVAQGYDDFYSQFRLAKKYLASSRPTAVNLFWALDRMEDIVLRNKNYPIEKIKELLLQQAHAIRDEDAEVCRNMGEHGLALLKHGDGILTHCNAGYLATAKYGTALAPIYLGHERGYNFKVYADETRPLLQGARLTAFELCASGIDTTLICDNMAAQVMKSGLIQAVILGCDRAAANGDCCNKIGTLNVAILAKHFNIPFYSAAPTSTIDLSTPTGDQIQVEQRNPAEVSEMWYKEAMAPKDVKIFNPAFDVTPNELITGYITENGIAYPPFNKSLYEMVELSKKQK